MKYLLEQLVTVLEYADGYDEDGFLRDKKTKDAVLTRLIVVGEYANKIDDSIKVRFADIDWKSIKLARNYYAHVYRGIDWILVWHVVEREIPALKLRIEQIIEVLENENDGKTN